MVLRSVIALLSLTHPCVTALYSHLWRLLFKLFVCWCLLLILKSPPLFFMCAAQKTPNHTESLKLKLKIQEIKASSTDKFFHMQLYISLRSIWMWCLSYLRTLQYSCIHNFHSIFTSFVQFVWYSYILKVESLLFVISAWPTIVILEQYFRTHWKEK